MTVVDFINNIAPIAKRIAPTFGIKVVSPCIAQAILESANGTSKLAVIANNFHGLKYRPNRCPSCIGTVDAQGYEQDSDGNKTYSSMTWCKFQSVEDGIRGYFEFLNVDRYTILKKCIDPKTYVTEMKKAGYATDPKYIDKVMSIIDRYELIKYDEGGKNMAKKVFLSAGHGGNDPGAVGNNLKEKDINLNIMLAVKKELERHGVNVVVSRLKDENDPVKDEVREANTSKADLAFSIHTNAGGGTGYEGYYYKCSGDSKIVAMGNYIAQLMKSHGRPMHGTPTKSGNHLYFLKNTTMPAFLVETGFIDNKKDVSYFDSLLEQNDIASIYAKGILKYFEIPYKEDGNQNSSINDSEHHTNFGTFKTRNEGEKYLDLIKSANVVSQMLPGGPVFHIQIGGLTKEMANTLSIQLKDTLVK